MDFTLFYVHMNIFIFVNVRIWLKLGVIIELGMVISEETTLSSILNWTVTHLESAPIRGHKRYGLHPNLRFVGF